MEPVIFAVAVLVAGLIMASGVWVATVLIANVARVKRPTVSQAQGRAAEQAGL